MNTYAEIDLNAIKHNVGEIKKMLYSRCKFMAVVKANAYGHGSVAISRAAMEAGADYLAVANLKEALEIREAGILAPILILTESPASVTDEIILNNLTQTIYTFEAAKALSETAGRLRKKVKVHLKVDTGMGRVGVSEDQIIRLSEEISKLDNLIIEGIFTHFARAEDREHEYTKMQFSAFQKIISQLKSNDYIKHAANSAATLFHPETHLDMVRVGLMMYGLYPNDKCQMTNVKLRPALSFKTKVVYLKKVPEGSFVSYGGIYVTPKETEIATLPVGYADGFSRRLSNCGQVLINGKRFPVVGNVTMDMILVDVGKDGVRVGDEVVLIGKQGNEEISANDLAKLEDTINYEIICGIGKRVPRIYK